MRYLLIALALALAGCWNGAVPGSLTCQDYYAERAEGNYVHCHPGADLEVGDHYVACRCRRQHGRDGGAP